MLRLSRNPVRDVVDLGDGSDLRRTRPSPFCETGGPGWRGSCKPFDCLQAGEETSNKYLPTNPISVKPQAAASEKNNHLRELFDSTENKGNL